MLPTLSTPVGPLACMQGPVLHQVGAEAEALPTIRAAVGLLSCVRALVPHKGGAVNEALPTGWALVRALAPVDAVVGDEVGADAEALSTVEAGVGLLACVGALVDDEGGVLAKAASAVQALVGSLPRVQPVVGQQCGALAEAPAAVGAGVRLLTGVCALVADQCGALAEAAAALRALVGLLPGVDPLVDDKVRAPGEVFSTLCADILLPACLWTLLPSDVSRLLVTSSAWNRNNLSFFLLVFWSALTLKVLSQLRSMGNIPFVSSWYCPTWFHLLRTFWLRVVPLTVTDCPITCWDREKIQTGITGCTRGEGNVREGNWERGRTTLSAAENGKSVQFSLPKPLPREDRENQICFHIPSEYLLVVSWDEWAGMSDLCHEMETILAWLR